MLYSKRFLFALPARPNQKHTTPETSSQGPDVGGPVPRPSDLPYLIVGVVVLGALVFIIVAFIPFCLWRAWAKQSECPLNSCYSLERNIVLFPLRNISIFIL